jgi:predicted nucleic acid-binding Zn ribbon protein
MDEKSKMGQMYRYECESCGYSDEVENVVVDAFFFSQNCRRGQYPTITCPECNGTMKYKML